MLYLAFQLNRLNLFFDICIYIYIFEKMKYEFWVFITISTVLMCSIVNTGDNLNKLVLKIEKK